jgi:hypothetical protein
MRSLLEAAGDLQWAGPRMWGGIAGAETFLDLDTAEDLARLGDIRPDMER